MADLFQKGDVTPIVKISQWYGVKWAVTINPSKEPYEVFSGRALFVWGTIIAVVSGLIGVALYVTAARSLWWSLLISLLYVIFPAWFSYWVYHDTSGVNFASVAYAILLYVIRGSALFDPHLVAVDPEFAKLRLDSVLKLYQQYFLVTLAVIGFVCSTFLFGVQSAFKEYFKGGERLFPAILEPYWFGYIAYSVIGILGLVTGVTREFHVKQDEVLRGVGYRSASLNVESGC